MTTIPEKIRDRVFTADLATLFATIEAVMARAEQWCQSDQVAFRAIGDEILLTLAKPLGMRVEVGQYAQLVDLDEEGR